jgi:hypothetical protein
MTVWTITLLFVLLVGAFGVFCAIKAKQPKHRN